MAALRKLLKAKGKVKLPKGKKHGNEELIDEDLERRKQQWQEDLEEMSSFLVIKSTEEQRREGATQLVDTAYIDDREGLPMLKAVFDVGHFTRDEVKLKVEDDLLTLTAQSLDDSRECSVFKKTMVRKLDLPKYVEGKAIHCELSSDGILTIEMPFHLPSQRRPSGPGVVPINTDDDGRKRIRFSILIGPDFTMDDVKVEIDGPLVKVTAFYDEEIGHYGSQITQRQIQRTFRLPERTEIDAVNHVFTPDGHLNFEVVLKDEKQYKCAVTTEELRMTSEGEDETDAESTVGSHGDHGDAEVRSYVTDSSSLQNRRF